MSDLAAAQAVSLPAPSSPCNNVPQAPDPAASKRSALSAQLAHLPLFADLPPERLHALVVEAEAVDLPAGGILFHQGDAARTLYVVVDGAVVPIAEDGARRADGGARRKLAVLERGDLVGEIGVLTRQPRNATVVALVDSKLLAIDRGALLPVMRASRELMQHILAPARRRMLDRQLRTNLFFAAFAPGERGAIARQFRLLEVKAGARLVRQGEPPEGLYLVLSGSLARIDPRSGQELGGLGIGDVFGGRSLLEGVPAPADVVAKGRAWVLVLGERRFRRIVAAHPRIVRVVQRLSQIEAGAAGPGAKPTPPNAPSAARRSSRPPSRPSRPPSSPRAPRAGGAGRAPRSRS
ncbi:MAG: cyclic nucleotide-binding domain-containing protein [Myxococcota bacterium]